MSARRRSRCATTCLATACAENSPIMAESSYHRRGPKVPQWFRGLAAAEEMQREPDEEDDHGHRRKRPQPGRHFLARRDRNFRLLQAARAWRLVAGGMAVFDGGCLAHARSDGAHAEAAL